MFYGIKGGEYNKYKISIIYTFSALTNAIDGHNNDMSFLISEIKNENQLKVIIEELKKKNEYNNYGKDQKILIHFEQFNSNKIQYISNFIFTNYQEEENYKYIFIIHINRNFYDEDEKRIYSLPDINQDLNQLFIDNLNGNEIKLKDILEKDIKNIFNDYDEFMNLNKEFNKALMNFINKNNFNEEIITYMEENEFFRKKIIDKAIELIKINSYSIGNCKNIVQKIMKIMNKNSIDIVSCLLDYIKTEIFEKYVIYILKVLEDKNFFKTIIDNVLTEILDGIKIDI